MSRLNVRYEIRQKASAEQAYLTNGVAIAGDCGVSGRSSWESKSSSGSGRGSMSSRSTVVWHLCANSDVSVRKVGSNGDSLCGLQ